MLTFHSEDMPQAYPRLFHGILQKVKSGVFGMLTYFPFRKVYMSIPEADVSIRQINLLIL